MAGKPRAEREARRARVAAAVERGDSPAAIAASEGLSVRQARRLVAELRDPTPAREVRPLAEPEPVRIEPFVEVARAFAVQRQVEEQCRQLAAEGRQETVRIGALKLLSGLALARLDLLDRIGALPRGPVWIAELRLDAAFKAMSEVAESVGLDVGELAEMTRRRVAERIDLDERGMVEMAATLAPLPRRHREAA